MNQVESTLHLLADDPFGEPAPANLADRALARARQRAGRRGALAVVGAVTVALVAVGATATAGSHRSSPAPAAPTATFAKLRMNLLLIGPDAVPGGNAGRTEVIKLASIDPSTGDTVMITFPPQVTPPSATADHPKVDIWPKGFNCAQCDLGRLWTWAESAPEYRNSMNPGLTATTQVVEKMTKLPVDDTVVLNLKGLKTVVDAVGGVDITVNQPVPIGGSPDKTAPDYHQAQGWIGTGNQHLLGDQVLSFVRARWNRAEDPMVSQLKQVQRQGCVLTALIEQVDTRNLEAAYPKLAKQLGGDLSTSIRTDELGTWAELLHRTQGARIDDVQLDRIAFDHSSDPFDEFQRQVAAAIAHQSPDPQVAWAEENVPAEQTSSQGVCSS